MDGFTISNANKFLETGKINTSEIARPTAPGDAVGDKSFADTLKDAVNSVNDLQKTADHSAQELATGRTDNVADVMINAEKAEIALKLMIQVRNKIIDAYQDIMKMQV